MKIKCRICGSENIREYGSTFCSETKIDSGHLKARTLFKCSQCKSISVEPVPSPKELSLYNNYYAIDGKNKNSLDKRRSLMVIHHLASLLKHGKVLDIGCGFGDVLASLPSSFKKIGLDIASIACQEAKKKGVEVLCSTWELADFNTEFDLIIALDFLEHVNDPASALGKIGKVLRRGGYVVIETGNADSWAAKTLREDWSYPAVYGHLQVLSPMALLDLAKNAQIEVVSFIKGRHSSEPLNQILYRGMLSYGYHILKLASLALKPVTGDSHSIRKLFYRAPPAAILRDHMILIGRKTI